MGRPRAGSVPPFVFRVAPGYGMEMTPVVPNSEASDRCLSAGQRAPAPYAERDEYVDKGKEQFQRPAGHTKPNRLCPGSCPVTITEVYAGMRPHEEKPTRAFMKSLVFLRVTAEIAEHAGTLKAQYSKRGKILSLQDVTIAAVSMAYGCKLVTQNIKDFPTPELQLYPLSKAA